MKNAGLIIMMTCSDTTVPDAWELFDSCKDLPVEHWGFKDNGISEDDRAALGNYMTKCGKKLHYELVDYSEAGYRNALRMAERTESGVSARSC